MKRLLPVLVASCVAGLQNEQPSSPHLPAVGAYDLWLDPSLSPASVTAVQVAAAQWSKYTGAALTLHSGSELCLLDCFSIHEVPQAQLDKLTDGDYVGYTIPGFIFLVSGIAGQELQQTAIHEMGHALGLVHHPLPAFAVMDPTYQDAALHVACDDVAQYFSVRGQAVPATVAPCSDAPGP